MKLQIRKLGAVSGCDALLVLGGWSDVVRVIGGASVVAVRVVRAQVGHLAPAHWVVRSNHDGLVLSVASRGRAGPLAHGIGVVMLRATAVWRVVNGLVAPIPCVERALRALVVVGTWLLCAWSYTAIWELRGYGLHGCVIEEALRSYLLGGLVSICFAALPRDN